MWKDDEYIYVKGVLRAIANSYGHIYEGIVFGFSGFVAHPISIAEYKADFDNALNEIGTGKWTGRIEECSFQDFRYFGRLQRLVIADIFGITEGELLQLGLVDINRKKGMAYGMMARTLSSTWKPFRA